MRKALGAAMLIVGIGMALPTLFLALVFCGAYRWSSAVMSTALRLMKP